MQITGADLVGFQHQVVELDRTPEGLVRRVGKAHAPRLRGAGQHVDHHAAGNICRSRLRLAQALDQRVDGINDIRAEKLRQDEIAIAIPFFLCSGVTRARVAPKHCPRQGDSVCITQILRELPAGQYQPLIRSTVAPHRPSLSSSRSKPRSGVERLTMVSPSQRAPRSPRHRGRADRSPSRARLGFSRPRGGVLPVERDARTSRASSCTCMSGFRDRLVIRTFPSRGSSAPSVVPADRSENLDAAAS